MTATAYQIREHRLDLDPHIDTELDVELLTAIDPLSLRPQLTVLEGGRADGGHNNDRGGAPARAVASRLVPRVSRGESEMVEIYRRRRFFAALAITLAVVALALASGLSLTSFGATPASTDPVPHVHVVSVGDTYPSIATELGADDPNAFAEALRSANGGAQLAPGQRLVVNLASLG